MKVLVVGGGGREHALVWKLAQSPGVREVLCTPGNAGIAGIARCFPQIAAEDVPGILELVEREEVGLTVIGPEASLMAGLSDALRARGRLVFGPSRAAARLEGSKAWAKEIMLRHGIPTARAEVFSEADAARAYLEQVGTPVVIKADGLAAGKGVVVAATQEEARAALEQIMEKRAFGAAGDRVVIEECLEGEEVSILAFSDGQSVRPMVPAQDHKRLLEDDRGPNTGGMGAYSPPPFYTKEVASRVEEEILLPTVRGLAAEGITYQGVLYAGLMLTAAGPKVLEFNARFGDPEAQAVLPRLESDLLPVLLAVAERRLAEVEVQWSPEASACLVLAAAGYPGPYQKGEVILGLADLPADVAAFHAGTAFQDGRYVTAGGRVLGLTARGPSLAVALQRVYQAAEVVSFAGCHYRRDIGARSLTTRQ